MAINKTSGDELSFQNDIEAEFGNNPLRSLGSYRNTHPDFQNENLGELTDLPLDTGIPKSGEIKFSDFYGKQLNIVVDLHSTGSSDYNLDVYTDRFVNGNYNIVGSYKNSINKNGWRGGKKVIIHINKTFGSAGASNQSDVAVKTGRFEYIDENDEELDIDGWPSATDFSIDVGSNGIVAGKGGNGGNAGNEEAAGQNGGTGTSAMKLINSAMQNVISIASGGAIIAGGGGGGSGSGSEQNDSFMFFSDYNSAGGGGGGGGAGIPAGSGGSVSDEASPTPGGNGSQNSGGPGGAGGDDSEAEGGNGGNGGDPGAAGGNASGGKSRAGANGNGGAAGSQYVFY